MEDHIKRASQGSEEEAKAIRSRLRLRLGALNDSLVSGQALHDACARALMLKIDIIDII